MSTTPTTPTTPDRPPGGRRRRSARARVALVGLALLAAPLGLAACSSAAPASDASSSAVAAGSWSSEMGSCLRDAGYDVADADLVEGVVAAPEGVDADSYADDVETCRSELPAGMGGGEHEGPSADDVAALRESGLEVAQCVRDAGFPDFADPVDGDFGMMSVEETPENRAFWDCDAEFGLHADGGAGR